MRIVHEGAAGGKPYGQPPALVPEPRLASEPAQLLLVRLLVVDVVPVLAAPVPVDDATPVVLVARPFRVLAVVAVLPVDAIPVLLVPVLAAPVLAVPVLAEAVLAEAVVPVPVLPAPAPTVLAPTVSVVVVPVLPVADPGDAAPPPAVVDAPLAVLPVLVVELVLSDAPDVPVLLAPDVLAVAVLALSAPPAALP